MYQPDATLRAQFRELIGDTARPGLFWLRRCRPTCVVNKSLARGWHLEARFAAYWVPRREVQNLRSAIWAAFVELDTAWGDLDR